MDKFSSWLWRFSYLSQKKKDSDIYQILYSGKNKKEIFHCCLLKSFQSMLSIKYAASHKLDA